MPHSNLPSPDFWLDDEGRTRWQHGYHDATAWLPVAEPDELTSMAIRAAQDDIEWIRPGHTLISVWGTHPHEDVTSLLPARSPGAVRDNDHVTSDMPPDLERDECADDDPVGDVNFHEPTYGAGFRAALLTHPRAARLVANVTRAREVDIIAARWRLTHDEAREVLEHIERLRAPR
jgi:hypothetical protein